MTDTNTPKIRIQGIGWVPADEAGNVEVGDKIMWNSGTTSEVTAIEAVSPQFIRVSLKGADGDETPRRWKRSSLVARIPRPAPAIEESAPAAIEELDRMGRPHIAIAPKPGEDSVSHLSAGSALTRGLPLDMLARPVVAEGAAPVEVEDVDHHMYVGILREDAKDMGMVGADNVRASITHANGWPVERLDNGAIKVGYSFFEPQRPAPEEKATPPQGHGYTWGDAREVKAREMNVGDVFVKAATGTAWHTAADGTVSGAGIARPMPLDGSAWTVVAMADNTITAANREGDQRTAEAPESARVLRVEEAPARTAPVLTREPWRGGQICGHQTAYGLPGSKYCGDFKALGKYECQQHHDNSIAEYGTAGRVGECNAEGLAIVRTVWGWSVISDDDLCASADDRTELERNYGFNLMWEPFRGTAPIEATEEERDAFAEDSTPAPVQVAETPEEPVRPTPRTVYLCALVAPVKGYTMEGVEVHADFVAARIRTALSEGEITPLRIGTEGIIRVGSTLFIPRALTVA